MVKSNTWMLKAPKELKDKLDKVRVDRIKNGLDKEPTPYRRLCLAMSRHEKLLFDLSKANLEEKR
jgi:hypothetical protein